MSNPLLATIVTCFLASGATGLLYETIWSKYLALYLGGSSAAHTLVLATYMGGLALGNHLFGPWADRSQRPLLGYAWLEVGVGAYGLLFPLFFPLLTEAYLATGTLGATMPLKFAVGAALLLIPTTLMGGTLPMLGKVLVRRPEEIGSGVGLLYFVNTLGAIAGAFLGGFVVVEALGLANALVLTAVVNLAIGALLVVGERILWTAEVDDAVDTPRDRGFEGTGTAHRYSRGQLGSALVAIGVGGALSMLYELVWIRLVAFVFGSSSQSFAVMLMTFIAGIALGGLIAARWLKRDPNALKIFAWAELGVAVAVLAVVPVYERLPFTFATARGLLSKTNGAYSLMQGLQVLILFGLMFVPTVLIGMTLPMATRVATRTVGELGAKVGRVFAVNTVGTVLGAIATGLVLIPSLGLQLTLYLGIISSAALGMSLLTTSRALDTRATLGVILTFGFLFGAVVIPVGPWNAVMLTAGFFRYKEMPDTYGELERRYADHVLLYGEDGVDGTVTVVQSERSRYLKVNGKTDASSVRQDMVTQMISGHLPVLLHRGDPKQVLVVGLGSGVTVGAVLQHDEVQEVDVVELLRSVVEASEYFSLENHNALADPRTRLHVGDAKEFMRLDERRYDVIISEPSNPWIAGVANLFSQEFFRVIYDKLNEDGLYVQWLQLYSFSDEAFARTLNTLRSVFPHVTVWRFSRGDALFVSSRSAISLDLDTMRRRLASPAVAADLGPGKPIPVASPLELLAFQALSEQRVSELFDGCGPLNSDYAPYLEFEAPRTMFRQVSPEVLDEHDERLGSSQNLLVSELLRAHPASSEELLTLSRRLAESQPELARRVRLGAYANTAVSYRQPGRALALRAGELDWLRMVDARSAARADVAPTAEVCTDLSEALAGVVVEAQTALSEPPLDRLDELTKACAAAHPQRALSLHRVVATVLFNLGRTRACLKYARTALHSDQGSVHDRVELTRVWGRAALELGDEATAASAYRAILDLEPKDREARRLLGVRAHP